MFGGQLPDTVDQIPAFAVNLASAMVEPRSGAPERGHGQSSATLLALSLMVESVTDTGIVGAAERIVTSKGWRPGTGSPSLGGGLRIAVAERLQLPATGGDR